MGALRVGQEGLALPGQVTSKWVKAQEGVAELSQSRGLRLSLPFIGSAMLKAPRGRQPVSSLPISQSTVSEVQCPVWRRGFHDVTDACPASWAWARTQVASCKCPWGLSDPNRHSLCPKPAPLPASAMCRFLEQVVLTWSSTEGDFRTWKRSRAHL